MAGALPERTQPLVFNAGPVYGGLRIGAALIAPRANGCDFMLVEEHTAPYKAPGSLRHDLVGHADTKPGGRRRYERHVVDSFLQRG
jgi:hypothetical protein